MAPAGAVPKAARIGELKVYRQTEPEKVAQL
jgi:hypothetical protein